MEDDFTAANEKSHSIETKSNKQKMKKIEWTPELHKKFVEAVYQLGVEQAVPSRILKFMKVEGLTRQNIASHLQKYRKQLRQSLSQARDYSTVHWSYHSNDQIGPNGVPMMLNADVWGYPVVHPSCPTNPQLQADVWGYPIGPSSLGSCPTYPQNGYYSAEADWMQKNIRNNIPEKSFDVHPLQADVWGYPIGPSSLGSCPTYPQNGYYSAEADWIDVHPGEEMIDKVVNEVMSKPWLPLPLGLKFHSIDTILTGAILTNATSLSFNEINEPRVADVVSFTYIYIYIYIGSCEIC